MHNHWASSLQLSKVWLLQSLGLTSLPSQNHTTQVRALRFLHKNLFAPSDCSSQRLNICYSLPNNQINWERETDGKSKPTPFKMEAVKSSKLPAFLWANLHHRPQLAVNSVKASAYSRSPQYMRMLFLGFFFFYAAKIKLERNMGDFFLFLWVGAALNLEVREGVLYLSLYANLLFICPASGYSEVIKTELWEI